LENYQMILMFVWEEVIAQMQFVLVTQDIQEMNVKLVHVLE